MVIDVKIELEEKELTFENVNKLQKKVDAMKRKIILKRGWVEVVNKNKGGYSMYVKGGRSMNIDYAYLSEYRSYP